MQTRSRTALALAIVSACGGGSSGDSAAKSEIECGASWETSPATAGTCDLACVEMTIGDGPPCDTTIERNGVIPCASTFEVDGERGCCFDLGMPGRVSGLAEPQRDRRVFFLSCTE